MPSAKLALFSLNVLFALDVAASAQEPQVLRIAELHGAAQRKALRLLLIHPPNGQFYDSLFATRLGSAPPDARSFGTAVSVYLLRISFPSLANRRTSGSLFNTHQDRNVSWIETDGHLE